jgi:hypothetical protein
MVVVYQSKLFKTRLGTEMAVKYRIRKIAKRSEDTAWNENGGEIPKQFMSTIPPWWKEIVSSCRDKIVTISLGSIGRENERIEHGELSFVKHGCEREAT